MTHNWNCPERWRAEDEGRRAFRDGYYERENPYRERYGEDYCRDAERSWKDGFHREEERRAEERSAEAAAERAAAARSQRERDEIDDMLFQQEQQYEEPPPDAKALGEAPGGEA